MKNFGVLLVKEETALFSSPIAYAVMTVFLLIMGYSFTLTLFLSHQPSLVHIFFQMFVLFMLTAPLITMRLIAEEPTIWPKRLKVVAGSGSIQPSFDQRNGRR